MIGLVLCGGQSSRMGSDKGLLKLEEKTWAQTAVDKMNILGIPIKLSINQQQYEVYAKVFQPGDLVTDNMKLELKGPLLGVLSCYIQHPTEDIFVLACDMPLMEPALLKGLYDHSTTHPWSDAYIYTNNNEPEPLCGIYTAKALSKVLTILNAGLLIKHSMKFMLDHIKVSSTTLPEQHKNCFRNFNAHAELNGL